jgi:hypothetical protein
MQTTHFWKSSDQTQLWWLNCSGLGRVHVKRPMDAPGVIILHGGSKNPAKMRLVQYDHVIKRVAPNVADDPLAVWILPRRSGGYLHFFDAQIPYALLETGAVDSVPISQQVTGRCLPGIGLDDLLGCPLGGWMLSNVDVHDATALMSQHDEYEEHAVCDGRHGEEVACHDVLDVIVEKGLPRGRGHIPADLVVAGVTAHRKPPEVRICRLRNQSWVGTRPPSTSMPHWPACCARR